jgi:hypothetical protein
MITHTGYVPNCVSRYAPRSVPPMVGTNIRQVVLPISLSNKTTVDVFGGAGESSLLLGDELIYIYTVTEG